MMTQGFCVTKKVAVVVQGRLHRLCFGEWKVVLEEPQPSPQACYVGSVLSRRLVKVVIRREGIPYALDPHTSKAMPVF